MLISRLSQTVASLPRSWGSFLWTFVWWTGVSSESHQSRIKMDQIVLSFDVWIQCERFFAVIEYFRIESDIERKSPWDLFIPFSTLVRWTHRWTPLTSGRWQTRPLRLRRGGRVSGEGHGLNRPLLDICLGLRILTHSCVSMNGKTNLLPSWLSMAQFVYIYIYTHKYT